MEEEGDDEEEEGDDEEDVTEIEEEAFAAVVRPAVRSTNYTDAEDVLLVRAWASVGMYAGIGTNQSGKLYWQRIEDAYLKMKPKNSRFISRTYRSLQGRWELMKPACSRWSAAMDQVMDAPPSGTVESDYVSSYLFSSSMLLFGSYVCLLCYWWVCRRQLPALGIRRWPLPRANHSHLSMFGQFFKHMTSGS